MKDTTRESAMDADCVRRALAAAPFDQYNQYWSLSDWKYAGTLALVKKGIVVKSVEYSLDHTNDHDPVRTG